MASEPARQLATLLVKRVACRGTGHRYSRLAAGELKAAAPSRPTAAHALGMRAGGGGRAGPEEPNRAGDHGGWEADGTRG